MTIPIFHRLPDWAWMGAFAVFRHVWIKDSMRNDPAAVAHELEHTRQQFEHPVWFWIAYVLLLPLGWNPWRARWEAAAYRKQLEFLQENQRAAYAEDYARILSGGLYLWCIRRKTALRLLTRPP